MTNWWKRQTTQSSVQDLPKLDFYTHSVGHVHTSYRLYICTYDVHTSHELSTAREVRLMSCEVCLSSRDTRSLVGSFKLQVSFAEYSLFCRALFQKMQLMSCEVCLSSRAVRYARLLKIMGLFCRIQSLLQGTFAKEDYNFKEPTNRNH